MRAIDHTDQVYGNCHVLGPGPKPKTWITKCLNCGTEAIRTSGAIRGMKSNAKIYRGCSACKHTYTEMRPVFGLRPKGVTAYNKDDSVRWVDGEGFMSTEIGLLQQRFYLGLLNPT